jgi:hypothetical protein
MPKRITTIAILAAFLLNACGGADAIKRRKMIVIAQHYPSYLYCNFLLEGALNMTFFDDTVTEKREGNVTCADYGRDEADNTIDRSCFVKDYGSDTNDTCVIGVNYTDYAGDVNDLFGDLVGETKKATK